jgi:predicted nucleic acid-binding protein
MRSTLDLPGTICWVTSNKNTNKRSSVTEQYVLDSWALLAMMQGEEPAASRVGQLLRAGERQEATLLLSMINLGEVYHRTGRRTDRAAAASALRDIRRLALTIEPVSDLVLAAADFKMEYAISYADAFAAALADRDGAILVSGDPDFDALEGRIRIEKLHRRR